MATGITRGEAMLDGIPLVWYEPGTEGSTRRGYLAERI